MSTWLGVGVGLTLTLILTITLTLTLTLTRQRAAFALGSPLELSLSPARLDGGGTHGRGGWLRKWSDVDARWRRVWCVLQGRALLCYAEAHAEMDAAAGGAPTSRSAVPEGADLERPTEVRC